MAGAASDDTALQEPDADQSAGAATSAAPTTDLTPATGTAPGTRPARPAPVRGLGFWALAGRHRTFTAILTIGLLLRTLAVLGYRPALFFNDSFDYLDSALYLYPHELRPSGYSLMLVLLQPFHSFSLVVTVQHLMGLAMGVMIYAVLRRRFGLPGWGAALATVPVLLDAYQIQLEHLILSDVPFNFLVVAVVTLLLWHARPSYRVAAWAGLLLGLAALTRSVGLPVLLAVVVFLVVRRVRWRIIAVTVATCVLPMAGYSTWYAVAHGPFTMTQSSGIFLYARVYKFANCHKIMPPVEEIPLCVEPHNRLPFSQDGIWDRRSPLLRNSPVRFSPRQNELASDFSKRAIKAQPLDYLRVVAGDFMRSFRWKRTVFPDRATYELYQFGAKPRPLPYWQMSSGSTAAQDATDYEAGPARTRLVDPFAGAIRWYQHLFYLRGALLGVILLIGLGGLLPLWRRFGGAALLPWITATGLLLAPAAMAEFDYRYVLPTVPLACLAAALTFTAEVRGRYWTAAWRIGRRLPLPRGLRTALRSSLLGRAPRPGDAGNAGNAGKGGARGGESTAPAQGRAAVTAGAADAAEPSGEPDGAPPLATTTAP